MNRQLIISVGLIQYQDKFLLTRRFDPNYPQWHHRWQLPGGKINPRESPLEALHREVLEETHLTIRDPDLLGVYTHHWQMAEWTQQTFILLYHCFVDHPHVILKPDENDAHMWEDIQKILTTENLLEGTVPMLQELYFKSRSRLQESFLKFSLNCSNIPFGEI